MITSRGRRERRRSIRFHPVAECVLLPFEFTFVRLLFRELRLRGHARTLTQRRQDAKAGISGVPDFTQSWSPLSRGVPTGRGVLTWRLGSGSGVSVPGSRLSAPSFPLSASS